MGIVQSFPFDIASGFSGVVQLQSKGITLPPAQLPNGIEGRIEVGNWGPEIGEAMRMVIVEGDPYTPQTEQNTPFKRTEVSLPLLPVNAEYYFVYHIWVPGYDLAPQEFDPATCQVMYTFNEYAIGDMPIVGGYVEDSVYLVKTHLTDVDRSPYAVREMPGLFQRGRWTQVILHSKWYPDNRGLHELVVDGRYVYRDVGRRTCQSKPGQIYYKVGQYNINNRHNYGGSSTMYFKNVTIYDGNESFESILGQIPKDPWYPFVDCNTLNVSQPGPGYRLATGTMVDPYHLTHGLTTWVNGSQNGGSVTPPSAANPYIVLNTGTVNGSNGRSIHRVPFTFGGLTDDDYFTLDMEFPTGNGPEDGDSVNITLSKDNLSSTSMSLGFTFQRYMEGRMALTFAAREFNRTVGEKFSGTTFNYIWVRYQKGPNGPATQKQCIFHGLWRGAKARPKFIFEFDLGHDGVYTRAKDLFAARNLKASVMITRSVIDTAGHCTTAQLQELHNVYGWDMGVRNGPTHNTFATVELLTAEMQAARQWNLDRGLVRGSEHCIYPVGILTPNSKPALVAAGFKTGRTTFSRTVTMDVGKPDLFNMPGRGLSSADAVADAKLMIDDAINSGKTARFYTHQVADVSPDGGISTAMLAEILDYVVLKRDLGLIDPCTVSEWHAGLGF